MKPNPCSFVSLAAGLALILPAGAAAQSLPYGDVSGASLSDPAPDSDEGQEAEETAVPRAAIRTKRVKVVPYIEAQQVVDAELSPGSDVLTYTALSAGVDASLSGRNNKAAVALRYERRLGYGDRRVADSDVVSGVARASLAVVPRTVSFEAGAMAARVSVENNGAALNGLESHNSTQVYSLFAGPSVQTHVGDLSVEGHYRIGYNRAESPGALAVVPGQDSVDVFDESTVHNAEVHAGFKAGTVLPIGLGLGAGWAREDTSNLDQRVDDKHARADATLPVGGNLALVGGVGYEEVRVSHLDAVMDPLSGLPVIGPDGRYRTDASQPRRIAYETDGLIWDAGVLWRPSKRTALEAHVGRRYGSTTYYGSFAYAPNSRMSVNLSVYDNVTGFGGLLNNRLAALPSQFEAMHNPLTGDLGGCVVPTGTVKAGQATCLTGALASVKSSVFRGRGVNATVAIAAGPLHYGIGAGYDRRTFIAAPGTVLAAANGLVDENYWVAGYLNARIDRSSSFGFNTWANWYQSGDALSGDVSAMGATAAYYRSLTSDLSATAAVGVQGVNRELLEDYWSAQGMVGVRYSF